MHKLPLWVWKSSAYCKNKTKLNKTKKKTTQEKYEIHTLVPTPMGSDHVAWSPTPGSLPEVLNCCSQTHLAKSTLWSFLVNSKGPRQNGGTATSSWLWHVFLISRLCSKHVYGLHTNSLHGLSPAELFTLIETPNCSLEKTPNSTSWSQGLGLPPKHCHAAVLGDTEPASLLQALPQPCSQTSAQK